jgi:hypothetical protein
MKEHFTLRYTSSEDNDTVMELDMNFDNPTDEILVKRLNDWLKVIGKDKVSVSMSANVSANVSAGVSANVSANANANEFIYSHLNDIIEH